MLKVKGLILTLIMLIGLTCATACVNLNLSPEAVAKEYINAIAKIDYDKIINCSDYKGKYKEIKAKKAAKALFELDVSKMPAKKRTQLKTYKFKSYQKLQSGEIEEIVETSSQKEAAVTETETGEITYTFKENGKGKPVEKTHAVIFCKVDKKWYICPESLINL